MKRQLRDNHWDFTIQNGRYTLRKSNLAEKSPFFMNKTIKTVFFFNILVLNFPLQVGSPAPSQGGVMSSLTLIFLPCLELTWPRGMFVKGHGVPRIRLQHHEFTMNMSISLPHFYLKGIQWYPGSKDDCQAESEEKMVEIVSETMVTLGRLENFKSWLQTWLRGSGYSTATVLGKKK